MNILPCQVAFLSTREDFPGVRIYRCEAEKIAVAISGAEADLEMLAEVCAECRNKERPDPTKR